ncbi:MAG TPA: hypothetical protein VL137_14280 [Polyangiaceae bacterium]|nr:hypothetical protein [Polyangiaceae bacterium]
MATHTALTAPWLKRAILPAVAALAFAGALVFSRAALASPNFPDVLQKVSGSNCAPSCLLCHSTNPGRATTAAASMKPFAVSVIGKGGVAAAGKGDAMIRDIFLKMKNGDPATGAPPTDSDMDGMSDFTELGMNINPNPGNADLCEVTYGCGARIAPAPPTSRLALLSSALVAVGLIGLGVRSQRRRR